MKLKCQRQFFAHRFVLFYALKGQQHRRCAGGVAGRKPGATKRGPVVAPEQATTALQARYDIPQTDRIIDRPGYRDGMSRGCRATPVKPANKARWELLSLVERKTAAQRDVERARIGLWVREGHANTVIAQELGGVSAQTACLWRKRIAQRGAKGIREGERSGRPPHITRDVRLQLIALACETHEPKGRVTLTLDETQESSVQQLRLRKAASCSYAPAVMRDSVNARRQSPFGPRALRHFPAAPTDT